MSSRGTPARGVPSRGRRAVSEAGLTEGNVAAHNKKARTGAQAPELPQCKGRCYNCSAKKADGVAFPSGVDIACARCWGPYPLAFSQHGSFCVFIDKKNKDEGLAIKYDVAMKNYEDQKRQQSWQPHEVKSPLFTVYGLWASNGVTPHRRR